MTASMKRFLIILIILPMAFWQKGGVESFVGQSPVEIRHDLLSVNRSASPLIHLNGDRAFVE